MATRIPTYRLHKARRCAVVTIAGTDHYLGAYDSPDSKQKYHRLIAEFLAEAGRTPDVTPAAPLTVAELVAAYWRFAKTYYVKAGRPTSEPHVIELVLRPVRRLYGPTPAADFTPRK